MVCCLEGDPVLIFSPPQPWLTPRPGYRGWSNQMPAELSRLWKYHGPNLTSSPVRITTYMIASPLNHLRPHNPWSFATDPPTPAHNSHHEVSQSSVTRGDAARRADSIFIVALFGMDASPHHYFLACVVPVAHRRRIRQRAVPLDLRFGHRNRGLGLLTLRRGPACCCGQCGIGEAPGIWSQAGKEI